MTLIRLTAAAVIAVATALTAPSAASAADQPYAFELDLRAVDTEAGAAQVYREIRRHASRLCRHYARAPFKKPRKLRACRAAIIDQAVADVNAPLVTARHAAQRWR